MKNFKNTPAFVRYFNARFKPFTKPLFLGSIGGLFIAGLAIYQYWRHPEWLQTGDENTIQQEVDGISNVVTPSPEDLSVAADIDNSDLLLKELEQNQNINELNYKNINNQNKPKQKESQYSRFQKSQKDKLQNPPTSLSDVGTTNQKITELLTPPSFSSYQSVGNAQNSPIKKFQSSKTKVIPNPIGNAYLSNRKSKVKFNNLKPLAPSIEKKSANATTIEANNGLSNPTNSIQENNGTTNNFVPASSVIQSQQTLPSPIVRANSSATPGFNITNPYLGTGFNSANSLYSNTPNNSIGNITPGNLNYSNNSTNGNSNNLSNNSYTSNINPIGGVNYSGSINNLNNSSNTPQNNYRSPQISPNYNRSVPSGYQLQPQGYTQNNFVGQNNGNSPNPGVNNFGVNSNGNIPNQPTNNTSSNNYQTPSLQPSGVLTTGEIRR